MRQLVGMAMGQSKVHWRAEGWVEKQPGLTKIILGLIAGDAGPRSGFTFAWCAVKSVEQLFCS